MAKSAKPRVSKLAAASASASSDSERDPLFPDAGKFVVKFKEYSVPEAVAGRSWEGIIAKFEGAGKDKKLGDVAQIYTTSMKALSQSAPRLRSLNRSLLGLSKADDAAFTEFDPSGEFVDALYNNEMDTAAEYYAEHCKALPKAARVKDVETALERLQNATVEAIVTRGGDTDDGDWYRNTSFRPIEADADDSEGDDEDDAPESEEAPRAAKKKSSKRAPVEVEDDEDDDTEEEDEDEPESEPEPKAKKKTRGK